jgi:gluconate 2-dehydrogenase gamma chain
MADERPLKIITRRDLLKGAGLAGAAAVAGHAGLPTAAGGAPVLAQSPASAPVREVFENLTAGEGDLLNAVVARLIPADALGPGAKEARAARYIDRALGGALGSSKPAYTSGLAALERLARSSRGRGFLELPAADQDSVLKEVEAGSASFGGNSTQFFNMVLNHTRQGTFGDPFYGGNADFIGWDLLQYPGVRTMVTAADQQAMERGQLKPNHKSAYDFETFNKATVSADPGAADGGHHAD